MATRMTCKELQSAIVRTMKEIQEIKQQITQTTSPPEKRRLLRKKRELQYLQLWHMSLLEQENK